MRATLFGTIVLVSLLLSPAARALDLWVDVGSLGGPCSDSTARTQVTKSKPWCSLAKAATSVEPGDTVHVRKGTYSKVQTCPTCDDNAVLQVVKYGTQSAPILFAAAQGEQVQISPGTGGATHGIMVKNGQQPFYVELAGFKVTGFTSGVCAAVKKSTHVTLKELEITGCTGSGAVELHQTSHVTVEGCQIHDNATQGWTSAVDLYLCKDNNVVRGNLIYSNQDDPTPGNQDSEGHGLTMDYCEAAGGAVIENNVLWNNEGWCMAIYHSDGATIRNNTCWTNGTRAGAGEISLLGNKAAVHNNILVPRAGRRALNIRYNQSGYAVQPSTITEDANILWASTHSDVVGWDDGKSGTVATYQAQNPQGWGKLTIQVDPKLVDPAKGSFQLQPSSPAIDTGLASHAAAVDLLGVPRPQDGDGDGTAKVDRGAYERVPPGSDAGVPPPSDSSSPSDAEPAAGDATGHKHDGPASSEAAPQLDLATGEQPSGDGDGDSGCGCALSRPLTLTGDLSLALLILVLSLGIRFRRRVR